MASDWGPRVYGRLSIPTDKLLHNMKYNNIHCLVSSRITPVLVAIAPPTAANVISEGDPTIVPWLEF